MKKNISLDLLAILSGLLVATSYIPFPLWSLFFAFVPLWVAWLKDPRPFQVFLRGWYAQIILSAIGFNWVAYSANQYGHLSLTLSLGVLFLYSALGNLHFPVAGFTWSLLYKKIKMSQTQSLFLFASLTFLYETYLPAIFPWNLGYPWLWAKLPAYEWADYIGFAGLSFLTYLFNFIFSVIYLQIINQKPFIKLSIFSLLFYILLQLTGYFHGLSFNKEENGQNFKVIVIQGNRVNDQTNLFTSWDEFKADTLKIYFNLTDQALKQYPDTDLIIWPEAAFPYSFDETNKPSQALQEFIEMKKKNFLIGSFYLNPETQNYYNAAFLIDKEGKTIGTYFKTILLAFGEYFPGATFFPSFKKWMPEISDFASGRRPTLFNLGPIKMGIQICYEGLYVNFVRSLKLQGATVFVNLTNDVWFGGKGEAWQHLYATMARSVEFRTPLIRATNTGLTSVINIDGSHQVISPFAHAWYHQYVVWVPDYQLTFYAQYGFLFPLSILILVISLIIVLYYRIKV